MSAIYYESTLNDEINRPVIFHGDVIRKNSLTHANWHSNIEVLCCIDGLGTVIYDNNSYEFTKGDIAVINSNCIHNVLSDDVVKYYCLIIGKDFFENNGVDIDSIEFCEKITDDALTQSFLRIAEAYANTSKFKIPLVRGRVLEFLFMLCSNYSHAAGEKAKNKSVNIFRIKEVIEYINENYTHPIDLDMLAERVSVSKYYLSREFKKYTGFTVFEVLNIVRCKAARNFIADKMTVSEAARSVGFDNMSYFSRTFKKYIGCLPSEAKPEG